MDIVTAARIPSQVHLENLNEFIKYVRMLGFPNATFKANGNISEMVLVNATIKLDADCLLEVVPVSEIMRNSPEIPLLIQSAELANVNTRTYCHHMTRLFSSAGLFGRQPVYSPSLPTGEPSTRFPRANSLVFGATPPYTNPQRPPEHRWNPSPLPANDPGGLASMYAAADPQHPFAGHSLFHSGMTAAAGLFCVPAASTASTTAYASADLYVRLQSVERTCAALVADNAKLHATVNALVARDGVPPVKPKE